MSDFTIRVKPDIIQERVNLAESQVIEKYSSQLGLDKGELHGDGVDLEEATSLPHDTFEILSGGDGNISKADIINFEKAARKQQQIPLTLENALDADDVVRAYAQQIANSLPSKIIDSASMPDGNMNTIAFKVIKSGLEIKVRGERQVVNGQHNPPALDGTSAGVFSVINGRDLNQDGHISIVGGELGKSVFVQTGGDAIKLAQGDRQVSPTDALQGILNFGGRVSTTHLTISKN